MAIMACVCTVSVFLYGIFLLMAVSHTAARTTAQRHIQEIATHLGDLEGHLLVATKDLTLVRAVELGFVPPNIVTTVSITDTAHTLSMRTVQ